MSDFKYEQKDAYTKEDIDKILNQHFKYAENSIKTDYESKLSEKDKLVSEVQANTMKEKQSALINTLPEKNRDLANAYIKASGKNLDEAWSELSEKHKDLFNETPFMGLEQAMQLEKQNAILKEQDDKIKSIQEHGAKTQDELELYAEHLKKVLK